jgi:hypothetical protein
MTMKHRRTTHLYQRGRIFYFRIRVPTDLVSHFSGRRDIRVSLRTSDPIVARYRALKSTLAFTDLFADLRRSDQGGDA